MRLIDEWRTVLVRSATTWVAAMTGALVGLLAYLVGVLSPVYLAAFAVIGFIPWPGTQLVLAVIVGAIVIGGPQILARLTAQPKMQEKIIDKQIEAQLSGITDA